MIISIDHPNVLILVVQWNPSCAPEKWLDERGGLSSGVEIKTFMFSITVSSGLSRSWHLNRVASQKGFHCSKKKTTKRS